MNENDPLATRASLFMRLRSDRDEERELSWEEFHARYGPVVLGFARSMGLNADESNDVLQDVMLGFYRVSSRFAYDPTKGRFRGYLKKCAITAMQSLRQKQTRAGTSLGIDPADEARTDAEWERAWTERVLERAMSEARSRFEPKTFEAFELATIHGVPGQEIAERLGIAPHSVYQAKSRVSAVVREVVERIRLEEG